MTSSLRANLPGLLLALLLAMVAHWLGRLVPVVGGPVFGIALGIVVASVLSPPPAARDGIRFTSKYVLQLAVILLGFAMNMGSVLRVGRESLVIMAVTLTAALVTTWVAGRLLRIKGRLAVLIGVGTAICGGSAIAAAAPAIDAEDQDISYAISTIFLFNVVAVFLFPLVGHLMNLSDTGFGMWAGTAINDTSSVVAAGYSYSDAAGSYATIVKLTRSLMIVPVTLSLALGYARNRDSRAGRFNFVAVFPWFILGFILAAILRTTSLVSPTICETLAGAGKFFITTALAAIGLNTDPRRFIAAGPRPLYLGAMTWVLVALSSLVAQRVAGML